MNALLPGWCRMIAATVIAVAVVGATPVLAQTIKLKEDRSGRGDTICTLKVPREGNLRLNFKESRRCKNDEASSLVLQDLPANTVIRLYDSPNFRENDDWVEIRTLRRIRVKMVPHLDRSVRRDRDVSIRYHRKNGLKGKVSSIVAGPAASERCRRPTVRLSTNGDQGPLVARGRGNCVTDVHLRIREHRPGQFDRTLAERKGHSSRLSVEYECKPHGHPQEAFAEFIFNGEKYRTQTVTVCGATLEENERRQPQRGYSAVNIFNCDETRRTHDVWTFTRSQGWQSQGTIPSEWANGGCLAQRPKQIDLADGVYTFVVVIDDGQIGCNTPSNPGSTPCQTLVTPSYLGREDGPVDSQTVN